jgi:2'-5' RNA ligase
MGNIYIFRTYLKIMESKLGLAIIPQQDLREQIINLSSQISAENPLSYTLSQDTNIPHMTLFQGIFDNKKNMREHFQRFATSTAYAHIQIKLDSMAIFGGSFIFYDVSKNSQIHALHEKTLEYFAPLTTITDEPIAKNQGIILTEKEQEYMSKYGYPLVKELYRPHFTIGRVLNTTNLPALDKFHVDSNCKFKPQSLVLYQLGVDGSCNNILEEYSVK